ncbi:MAG: acyl-CoA thioesterase [Desulfobulbaceae bacterium]|nr:MAG: acyl-CoA thioesterase [Desulfobulbaceae bacterium]
MTSEACSVTMAHMMLPQHANPAGNVHGGVIMKFIDDAAGVVAAKHARTNTVTASIDRLDFHRPVFIGNLLILRASLNSTGRSSMEIGVRVEAEDLMTGETKHIASAYLTFVSLNAEGRPSPVPSFSPTTPEGLRRAREAMQRKECYRQLQSHNKEHS